MSSPDVIKDLLRPKPWLYWMDLAFSSLTSQGLILWAAFQPAFSWPQIAALVLASHFGMRAGNFIHELQHAARAIKGFERGFNFLFGWPARFPSYLYSLHARHHQTTSYATLQDPEVDRWGTDGPKNVWFYIARDVLASPLFYVRLALYPIVSFLMPKKANDFIYSSASSIGANSVNARKPDAPDRKKMERSDRVVAVYSLALFGLSIAGWLPWSWHVCAYAVSVLSLAVTEAQTFAFHYFDTKLERSSFEEQMRDTLNYPSLWSEIWAPLNARYHLLHHMFPMLPYHSFPEAHRRLMKSLPEDHVYRQNQASLWPRLLRLRPKPSPKSAAPQTKQSA